MPPFLLQNKCLRCDCFSGRILFYRNLQTFRLRGKSFSVWIFMRSEMFSEETAWFCKIALSTTILSLRELFRRIKTTSTSLHLGKAEISPRQAMGADERTRSGRLPRRNLRKQMEPGNIAMISLNGYLDYSRLGAAKCEARRRQPGNIAMISLNCFLRKQMKVSAVFI